jgi:hypothetical protein
VFILESQQKNMRGVWVYPSETDGSIGYIEMETSPFGEVCGFAAYRFTLDNEQPLGYTTDFFRAMAFFNPAN